MAIPPTPKPAYPNVPNVPGAPSVFRQVGSVQNTVGLLVADAGKVLSLFSGPQWGLFTAGGSPVFESSSVTGIVQVLAGALSSGGLTGYSIGEVEYRRDYRISTAPQEQGAFMSYNKVQDPFDARVTYIVSGTMAQRSAFLAQVEAAEATLNQFVLLMPEISYPSCDVVHHDLRRNARSGATMITVDIWVKEVRVVGTAQYSNTATPSGADPVNGGQVQPLQVQPNSLPVGAIT